MTESFTRPHYSKSPIAEALIDVRTRNADAITLEDLDKAASALSGEFPTQLPIYQFEMAFEQSPHGPGEFTNNQLLMGRRLTSKSLQRVLQLQRVGFTYSHLPPYTDWDSFCGEARKAWSTYRTAIGKQNLARVAVRVINHIPVPSGEVDIKEYLAVHAVVPNELPPVANAAYVQLQLSVPKVFPEARAIINVASGTQVASSPRLILDIDLFVEREVRSDDEMWEIVEVFGLQKDKIFESCITDKVREAIK